MSVAHTSSDTLSQRGSLGRFGGVGILTLLAAVAMNTLIVLAAHSLFTVLPTFVPLQFESVIPATAVVVVGALVVFALLNRWSQQPARLFRRIAGGVLLVSIIPVLLLPVLGVYPSTTWFEVGTLLLVHTATALLCISVVPRTIDARV